MNHVITTWPIDSIIDSLCDADQRSQHEDNVIGYGGHPTFPTIKTIVTAYTDNQMGAETYDAVTKLIDPFDLYLYPALADSERQMIALIEFRRPQKAVRA